MAFLALAISSCDTLLVDYSITAKYIFENKTKETVTASFDISVPEKMLAFHESDNVIEKTITVEIPAKGEYEGSCPIHFGGTEVKDIEALTNLDLPLFDCCRSVTFTWPDGTKVTHNNPVFHPEDTAGTSLFLEQNHEKETYYARRGFQTADSGYPIYTFTITK